MRSDRRSREWRLLGGGRGAQRGVGAAMRALVLVGGIFLAPWHSMAAQEHCTSPTPAVCYTHALVQGLLAAHRTTARFETSRSVAFATAATDFMYASYKHQTALREAQQAIDPWTTNTDSTISGSAKSLVDGYAKMLRFQEQTIAMLKADMDGSAEGGMGSMAERLAQLKMLRDSAVLGIGYGVVFATHALVAAPGPGGREDRLVVTAAERQALLRLLREGFAGPTASSKRGRPASDFSEAAKILRTFLADPGWKSAVRLSTTSSAHLP